MIVIMPDLPIHTPSDSVPVFDCHVLIEGPDETGMLTGVVSNLPEVAASASSERELLRKLTSMFKSRILEYQSHHSPIPWQETKSPSPGQRQRWIPVHL